MNPNLLIVDDEKPTRDGLRAALEDRYEVYLTEDAASAARLLESESFEVLLTDFRLPNNEDGMKLIARAKSLAKPPICILMTAYGSEELAVEALKQGADDYLAKGRMQIDELETRTELDEKDVAVERQQVDEHAVDAVAHGARRTPLLVLLEVLERRPQGGRNGAPGFDAELP